MSDQLGLLDTDDEGPRLTDRQQHALDTLARLRELTEDAVGCDLHAWQGRHPADRDCEWCRDAGLEVLRALRRKGLVVQRRSRGGVWELTAEGRGLAGDAVSTASAASPASGPAEDPADVFGF